MIEHTSVQARREWRGRAPLFLLVSKQNLNPSSWLIWHIKNRQKQIKNEKIMAPQSKRGHKLWKTKIIKHYKGKPFLELEFSSRVNRLMTKHTSVQARCELMGGLRCFFWCPNKTWTSPLGSSDTLRIAKSELKMRK